MTTASEASQPSRGLLGSVLGAVAVPILALFTALVVSGTVMLLAGTNPLVAYAALAEGAVGTQKGVIETLIKATPFIFASLGIALAFRGGLFNIGVEGQLFVGSIVTAYIGYAVPIPAPFHLPVALLAGVAGGALWAAIAGYLKARTGAHEVITTIMLNFIALRVINWAIGVDGPMRAEGTVPQTPAMLLTARMPLVIPDTRLHWGFFLSLVVAAVVYWLLWRTIVGFEIRTVGANPSAARYAGINVERNIVLTMALSGALAGLAGAVQVVSLEPYVFTTGFNVGYGFDSIAVAVLGSIHPAGVVLASLLFGAMDAGARLMQLRTKVPIDIITIVQGLVLMFVAADQIIRSIYRIRARGYEGPVNLGQFWGGGTD